MAPAPVGSIPSAMADEKLREMERRWRTTGAVEDEAAWLGERARVGDLDPEHLRLAAYLGDRASQLADPDGASELVARLRKAGGPLTETINYYEPPPSGVLAEWGALLPTRSKDVCVRTAVAACRAALLATDNRVIRKWANEVLGAIERWLLEPRTRDSLVRLAHYWWSHTRNSPGVGGETGAAIGWAVMSAQILASYDPEGWPDPPEDEELQERDNRMFLGDALAGAQHALGVERTSQIEQAVRDDVVPWLHGRCDPVADRRAATKAKGSGGLL